MEVRSIQKDDQVRALKDDREHVKFVQSLLADATEHERVNYQSYLRALRDGLLENHQGRYVYISKGKMLNKSFKRPHDAVDHISDSAEGFPYLYSLFIYVPQINPQMQQHGGLK
jgi:hypothetical protein